MSTSSGNRFASATYASTDGLARGVMVILLIEAACQFIAIYVPAVGVASSLLALIGLVLFLLWFYRVYRNLPTLGANQLRFTPGWAVVWWFIPILNFWKPYQVTVEIMKSSDPAIGNTDSETRKGMRRSRLVLTWWVFSFVAFGIALAAGLWFGFAETLVGNDPSQTFPVWLSLTVAILVAIDTWLTILVIKEISKRQDRKSKTISSGSYGSP